jgi:hypothetical protein
MRMLTKLYKQAWLAVVEALNRYRLAWMPN